MKSTKNEQNRRPVRPRARPVEPTALDARPVMARSLFGHVPELHRPRLVVFVGAAASSLAPVAALWFGALATEGKATIVLAYADGALATLSPEMMLALAENGLDPRRLIARTLTPDLVAAADLVVTLSSGRQRLKLPVTIRRREHWTMPDPTTRARAVAGRRSGKATSARARAPTRDALAEARSLRDALRARVAMLVFSEGWGRPEISREDARVTRARFGAEGAFDRSLPDRRNEGFLPGLVSEMSPAWFPTPSLSAPSLR